MSRFPRAASIGLVIGVFGVVLANRGLALEERFGLDPLFRIRGGVEAPPDIVIVGIDEATAETLGFEEEVRLWDRSVHARLIDNLVNQAASLIVFDVGFTTPGNEDNDAELAKSIAESERVVLLALMERLITSSTAVRGDVIETPIPLFSDAARGFGPFYLPQQPEIVRQFEAFRLAAGEIYPSLPVVTLQIQALESIREFRDLLRGAGVQPLDAVPLDEIDLGRAKALLQLMRGLRSELRDNPRLHARLLQSLESDERLSSDQRRLWTTLVNLYNGSNPYYLNFYGEPETIPIIRYERIIADGSDIDVAGKVVFVGQAELFTTVQGDTFNTPFSREDGLDLSGVEIAATAFANLRTGRSLARRLDLQLGSLLLFGVLASTLACLVPGLRAIAAALGLGGIYFGAVYLLFVQQDLWLPVVTPLAFQLPLALVLGLFVQFRVEKSKSDRWLPWVPKKVTEAPIQAGQVFGVVLRTDIEGSTTLSDRLSDDAVYGSLLGQYLELVRESAVRFNGRVLETRGDDVMCFWESRKEESSLRRNACLAALEIQQELDIFNQQQDEGKKIGIRTGLNAGWVHVGQVGPIGELLNTVSRIERANERLGTKILASEQVVADLDGFSVRRLGSFELKGKIKPVKIFEVAGLSEGMSEDEEDLHRLFGTGLDAFEAHRWAETAGICEEILSQCAHDGPARFYREISQAYLKDSPPPENPSIIRL